MSRSSSHSPVHGPVHIVITRASRRRASPRAGAPMDCADRTVQPTGFDLRTRVQSSVLRGVVVACIYRAVSGNLEEPATSSFFFISFFGRGHTSSARAPAELWPEVLSPCDKARRDESHWRRGFRCIWRSGRAGSAYI